MFLLCCSWESIQPGWNIKRCVLRLQMFEWYFILALHILQTATSLFVIFPFVGLSTCRFVNCQKWWSSLCLHLLLFNILLSHAGKLEAKGRRVGCRNSSKHIYKNENTHSHSEFSPWILLKHFTVGIIFQLKIFVQTALPCSELWNILRHCRMWWWPWKKSNNVFWWFCMFAFFSVCLLGAIRAYI